jgi:hypothetical protein
MKHGRSMGIDQGSKQAHQLLQACCLTQLQVPQGFTLEVCLLSCQLDFQSPNLKDHHLE